MEKVIQGDAIVNNEVPLSERVIAKHRFGSDRPIDNGNDSASLSPEERERLDARNRGLHTKTQNDVNADRDYTRADLSTNPLIAKAHADGEQAADDVEEASEESEEKPGLIDTLLHPGKGKSKKK